MFHGTVFSLLPAVIAIVLALITKEVYSSLFAGIFVGAFLSVGFHPVAAFNLIVVDGLSAAVYRRRFYPERCSRPGSGSSPDPDHSDCPEKKI